MSLASFAEILLDVGRDYRIVGGPEFSTRIVATAAGREQRDQNWEVARGRWDLGERHIKPATKEALQAFFRCRRGSAQGFRFKDWTDYQAMSEALAATGARDLQLLKTYDDGSGNAYVRTIAKPRAATVELARGGAPYAYTSLDEATGLLTLTPDASVAIGAIGQTSPAVVTTEAAHGLSTGVVVWLAGISGNMASLANAAYTVTVTGAATFTLAGVDATGLGAHDGSGTVETYPQGETLAWSGEFDVPVRFETDAFRAEYVTSELFHLESLPVVEIKL